MPERDLGELQGRRTVVGNTPRDAQVGDLELAAERHRQMLEKIRSGGIATKVRILASHDSCPVCKALEGAYEFDNVPALPHEGCSHPQGCRCHYAPVLDRFGP
ncbi:MAG TPA: hypothetical protein VF177_10240 [Anaerolineae bacterium]